MLNIPMQFKSRNQIKISLSAPIANQELTRRMKLNDEVLMLADRITEVASKIEGDGELDVYL